MINYIYNIKLLASTARHYAWLVCDKVKSMSNDELKLFVINNLDISSEMIDELIFLNRNKVEQIVINYLFELYLVK